MEHTNENERMYALLCKVVFGEATDAEEREVNAALEASAELREQKAELLATVSLVRGAFGEASGGDELPAATRGALATAAADAARGAATPILRGPWYSSPSFRAAAAVTLLAGAGYAAVLALDPGAGVEPETTTDVGLATPKPVGAQLDMDYRLERAKEGLRSRPELLGFQSNAPSETRYGEVNEALVGTEEAEVMFDALQTVTAHDGGVAESLGAAVADPSQMVQPLFGTSTGELTAIGYSAGSGLNSEVKLNVGEFWDDQANARPKDSTAFVGYLKSVDPAVITPSGDTSAVAGVVVADVPASVPVVTGGGAGGGGRGGASSGSGAPSGVVNLPFAAGAAPGVETASRRSSTTGPTTIAPVSPESKKKSEALGSIATSSDDFFLGRGEAEDHARFKLGEFERGRRGWSFDRIDPTRLPNERPHDMFFRFYGDNPFVVSKQDALSTFAADVDTASFALARRTLESGFMPQRAQIRTEEFVNFATPDLAHPTEGTFAMHAELAPSPFGGREDRWLLRVGVRAKDIPREERPPLALTFVVDTSGSMKENNRLELVKHALRLLVDQLDQRDTIALVAFSNEARTVLGPTPATASDTIETALFELQPDGSTNAEAGLKLGYWTAETTLAEGVQTRVVFLSDGVANVGQTDQDRIADDVRRQSERGIFLNTIGVGLGNHNDVFLEQLADKGEGVCDYVGDAKDARRAIVERFVGGFLTVAKDVKIQLEFAPSHVLRWRQLGYENRAVRDADFRNDAVDAGEIGAGHQVTCLYEVELASTDIAAAESLGTIRLRWKPVTPGELQPVNEVAETSHGLSYSEIVAPSFRAASEGFRRGALAAQLAECLRRSVHVRGDSVEVLGKELAQLLSDAPSEDTAMIAAMTRGAIQLGMKSVPGAKPTDMDAAHRRAYYRALIRDLGGVDPIGEASGEAKGEDGEHGSGTPPSGVMFDTYETHIRDILNGDSKGKPH